MLITSDFWTFTRAHNIFILLVGVQVAHIASKGDIYLWRLRISDAIYECPFSPARCNSLWAQLPYRQDFIHLIKKNRIILCIPPCLHLWSFSISNYFRAPAPQIPLPLQSPCQCPIPIVFTPFRTRMLSSASVGSLPPGARKSRCSRVVHVFSRYSLHFSVVSGDNMHVSEYSDTWRSEPAPTPHSQWHRPILHF